VDRTSHAEDKIPYIYPRGVPRHGCHINGRGKIQISGVESHDLRAVIGGTGDFVNARGQGNPHVEETFGDTSHIPPTGQFLIEFRLTGARGRPIG